MIINTLIGDTMIGNTMIRDSMFVDTMIGDTMICDTRIGYTRTGDTMIGDTRMIGDIKDFCPSRVYIRSPCMYWFPILPKNYVPPNALARFDLTTHMFPRCQ
jgi:hypothetical protein